MRKIHGWYIFFVGYVFQLLGIVLLLQYAQMFINILAMNPYLLLAISCGMLLTLMGTYVIHRSS